MIGTTQLERQRNRVVFESSGTRVSVIEQLRIDRRATTSGLVATAQLRPISVLVERPGKAKHIVDLDQLARANR